MAEASLALSSTLVCSGPSSGRAGHQAQRGLAVLHAPEAVGAGPVAGRRRSSEPVLGAVTADDAGQLAEQPGEVGRADVGQPVRAVAGEGVAPVADQRGVQVPAVAGAGGGGDRREADPQPVRAGGGVDGLADQHLGVARGQRVLGGQGELDLGPAVLRVQLADLDPVGVEVDAAAGGRTRRRRAARWRSTPGRGARARTSVVASRDDDHLDLEAGPHLEAGLGRGGDLALEHGALVVGPRAAVGGELATVRPGQPGLPGQRHDAADGVDHRHQPHVARRRRQPLVGEGDAVVGVEDREHRGDADPAPGGGRRARRSGTIRERTMPLLSTQPIFTPTTSWSSVTTMRSCSSEPGESR